MSLTREELERQERYERQRKEEAEVDAKLFKLGLRRKQQPKDGDCLFRAIAEGIYLTSSRYTYVRRECVDFMQKQREFFQNFVENFEAYCADMRKAHKWGGEIELAACSQLYKCNIVVYSIRGIETEHKDNTYKKTIHLCYLHGNHYDLLYPVKFFEAAADMQDLIYEVLEKSLEVQEAVPEELEGTGFKREKGKYRNVEYENWLSDLIKQRKRDEKKALKMNKKMTKKKFPFSAIPSSNVIVAAMQPMTDPSTLGDALNAADPAGSAPQTKAWGVEKDWEAIFAAPPMPITPPAEAQQDAKAPAEKQQSEYSNAEELNAYVASTSTTQPANSKTTKSQQEIPKQQAPKSAQQNKNQKGQQQNSKAAPPKQVVVEESESESEEEEEAPSSWAKLIQAKPAPPSASVPASVPSSSAQPAVPASSSTKPAQLPPRSTAPPALQKPTTPATKPPTSTVVPPPATSKPQQKPTAPTPAKPNAEQLKRDEQIARELSKEINKGSSQKKKPQQNEDEWEVVGKKAKQQQQAPQQQSYGNDRQYNSYGNGSSSSGRYNNNQQQQQGSKVTPQTGNKQQQKQQQPSSRPQSGAGNTRPQKH